MKNDWYFYKKKITKKTQSQHRGDNIFVCKIYLDEYFILEWKRSDLGTSISIPIDLLFAYVRKGIAMKTSLCKNSS